MVNESRRVLTRIARNTGLMFGSKAFGGLCGLFYLALAGRALGAGQLGVLILVHSTAIAFREVASFKSWQALIRYGASYLLAQDSARFHGLLRLTLVLDVAGAVMGSMLSAGFVVYFAPLLGIPAEITLLAVVYCLSTLFALKSTPVGVLRLLGRFDLLARQALIVPILRVVGVVGCWALGLSLTAYIAVWFFAEISAALALMRSAWKVLQMHPLAAGISWRWRWTDARSHDRIWPFIWSANLDSTVGLASSHLPVLLSGALLNPAAAAFVKVCQEIAGAVKKPGQLLAETVYPEVSTLTSQENAQTIRRLTVRSLVLGIVAATVLVGAAVLGGEGLLVMLFGEEFRDAHALLMLLVISAGLQLMTFIFEPLLYAQGRPGFVLVLRSFAAAVQVGWMVLALPRIGLEGVGQAVVVGSAIIALLMGARVLATVRRRID